MTLKLDRFGESLVVRVGPRVNWLGLLTALLLVLILGGAGIVPAWEALSRALHAEQSPNGYILGIIALSGIALCVVYNVVLALFRSEFILINPSELEIQSRIFGMIYSRRSFPNSTVEKLRYEEWWSGARGTSTEHGLRFECVGGTITFARNATTLESHDIIDAMGQLYKFPMVDPPEEESSPAVTNW